MPRIEAEGWRDRILVALRDGTFKMPGEKGEEKPAGRAFNDVADMYLAEYVHVKGRRPKARQNLEININLLRRVEIPAGRGRTIAFGEMVFAEITPIDLDAIREARRAHYRALEAKRAERAERVRGQNETSEANDDASDRSVRLPGCKRGEVSINRLFSTLRHIFT